VLFKLLDPTLDIIFKVEAVLNLPAPLQELKVLNPEIPKDFPGDKAIVLDIRARLHDGRQVDLEMQSTFPPGTRARFLYYWAKAFASTIGRGEVYTALRPCISILWFKDPVLDNPRFHSIFHLSEDHSRELFAPDIEFHVLELPRLHLASPDRQARLERWARFLRATTVEEFEELAREDAVMTTAKNILEELSGDSEAQRLADERETAILMHRHLMTTSFEHGEAKGEVKGEAKGLRIAIHSMCGLLGIELDTDKSAWISGLNAEQLTRVVKFLERERKWPETL
jgi:predicted transposase/invertase (TIGR01784 family)